MTSSTVAADYRGEDVTGRRFRRAYRVTISNPYGGEGASIAFDEEQITDIEGAVAAQPTATLIMPIDLAQPIDLFDPASGKPLGAQASQLDVYVALYSVYRALGAARDAAEAVQS